MDDLEYSDTFSAASTDTLLSGSPADVQPEKLLAVSDGRTLAYAEGGDISSSIVVIHFHSIFSIGQVNHLSMYLLRKEKGVHFLAPTLPGWGKTSPPSRASSFAACVIADITALLEHLSKDRKDLRIYVCGSKYGSIPAQILYGAPFDIFPLGRHISALLIPHPFCPFRSHTQYTPSFNFLMWMMFGAPSRILPSNLVLRYYKRTLKQKLSTTECAQSLVRRAFSGLKTADREVFVRSMKKQGLTEEQAGWERARAAVMSVSSSWEGYLAIPSVIRSDWGFMPAMLDEEHARRPVLIVTQKPCDMGQRLVEDYKNVHPIYCKGTDFCMVREAEDIWECFLSMGVRT